MYSHTKKVGSLGRYGPRIGRKIRDEVKKVEDESKRSRGCPQCGKPKLKRKAAGVWGCKACSYVFAGGAYIPSRRKPVLVPGESLE